MSLTTGEMSAADLAAVVGNSNGNGGRGGSRGGRGGYSREGGYSYADENEEKIEALREAMQDAESEQERMIIKKIIRRMEQD